LDYSRSAGDPAVDVLIEEMNAIRPNLHGTAIER